MVERLTITESADPVHTLHLSGKLDGETHNALMDAARRQYEAGTRHLLLDLSGVEFVASAGLGTIHQVYKLFTPEPEALAWEKAHPGEPYKSPYLKLAGVAPAVYYVLSIAGFLQNIPIYADLDEGLRSFSAA